MIMLSDLLIKIDGNKIIRAFFFEKSDVEELLDMRDSEKFESEWMRVYDDLNEFKVEVSEKEKIDSIRKKSFLKAYKLSGSSDIAGCVSDDFEIICRAYLACYDDTWVKSLIMSYAKGKFPCGELEKTEGNIEQCMKRLCKN